MNVQVSKKWHKKRTLPENPTGFVSILRIFPGKVEDLPVFSGLFCFSAAVVQRFGRDSPPRRCWPICCAISSGLWLSVHHPERAAHGGLPCAVLLRCRIPVRGIHHKRGRNSLPRKAVPPIQCRSYSAPCLSTITVCSGIRFSRMVASIIFTSAVKPCLFSCSTT